jgi:hypothetical protein
VGSKTCQFSQAYVIAHEIGHHVQNLNGWQFVNNLPQVTWRLQCSLPLSALNAIAGSKNPADHVTIIERGEVTPPGEAACYEPVRRRLTANVSLDRIEVSGGALRS